MEMIDHKLKLDKYITNNYNYLLQISQNVTQRINDQQKYNLLHEVILSIYDRLDKHNNFLKSETDFKKYTTNYIKQFYNFKKNSKHNERKDNSIFTFEASYDDCNIYKDILDDKAEQLIYIDSEFTNVTTKLFLKDMCLNDITMERAILVNHIITASDSLSDFEREIFDMYYLQELSCSQIYKYMKGNSTKYPAYQLILDTKRLIKEKIINKLKCQLQK